MKNSVDPDKLASSESTPFSNESIHVMTVLLYVLVLYVPLNNFSVMLVLFVFCLI